VILSSVNEKCRSVHGENSNRRCLSIELQLVWLLATNGLVEGKVHPFSLKKK
jgi:hypothetical protein